MPAGYCEPEGFARAKRRSAEGTPFAGFRRIPGGHTGGYSEVSGCRFARASGHRPRRFAEAPEGKRQYSEATLRRLVAGKAPWQAARYACRLACCACRSSSQKSRFAAIFGSPVITPLGVSADSQIHPKCSHPYGWLPFWHTRRKRTRRVRASEATPRRGDPFRGFGGFPAGTRAGIVK